MTTDLTFAADLTSLPLCAWRTDFLSTVIEDRAATLWELGCSPEGIANAVADIVGGAGLGDWPLMMQIEDDGEGRACVIIAVLTHATLS